MNKPGGGRGLFLTTAVIVGLPLGLGLALLFVCAWTFATTDANFERQVAGVLGAFGGVAVAPTVIWALAFAPWMRRRVAAGQRSDLVLALILIVIAALVGIGLLVGFELLD